ncbi:SLAM family member 9-like [Notechis scutatus]|uniref:SLAM family member 9-like n=1 Tax=Notechis scutatus TaxID=8663 RepID=A0A6J1VX73_9SAUR|nr:SLAM family member 9-like [Notechis scutatus]
MRHKDAFWVTLLLVYFQAETSAIQLNGVLGESVTFQINDSKPFATISWSKTEKKNRFRVFALVAPGNPCKILVPIQAFKQRISSSKDCRNLQLSHLSQEDINRYTANIVLTTSESINEHFDLKVYRRLQSTDLSIKCKISRGQTELFHLMCSVGKWGDQLDLQWFVAEDLASHVTRESLLTINYTSSKIFDQEVSCQVENPVSKVSRNMTLSEACPRLLKQPSRIQKALFLHQSSHLDERGGPKEL